MKFYLLALSAGLTVGACSSANRNDSPLLREAGELHIKMVSEADSLEEILLQLKQDSSSTHLVDSAEVWQTLLESWEEELVEVPGYESGHDHDHESGHHHTHEQVDVTPEQMLKIQQALRERLNEIQLRVKSAEK